MMDVYLMEGWSISTLLTLRLVVLLTLHNEGYNMPTPQTSQHQFYIHGSTYNQAGESSCYFTQQVESKEQPMLHHNLGLSYTATGYGSRLPTRYMVKFLGKWRRVYCRCYSNNGTLYIGTLQAVGERLIVRDYQ